MDTQPNRFAFITSALAIFISALTLLSLPGCFGEQAPKSAQAEKAKAVAASIAFTENAEIDNIKRRLELTSKPGLLGYIVLINESGQPVYYASVKGKITSGSKRLTEPDRAGDYGSGTNNVVRAAPSDEGTWGSSSDYVFFWTTSGQYVQWNGKYFYSDQPIRLSVQPLVVSVEPPAKQ